MPSRVAANADRAVARLRRQIENLDLPCSARQKSDFDRLVERYRSALEAAGYSPSSVRTAVAWALKAPERWHERQHVERRRRTSSPSAALRDRAAWDFLRDTGFRDARTRALPGSADQTISDRTEYRERLFAALRQLGLWKGTTAPVFDDDFQRTAELDIIRHVLARLDNEAAFRARAVLEKSRRDVESLRPQRPRARRG